MVDYRPINEDDLEACVDVFYAADDDLMGRRALPIMPRNRPPIVRLFAHIAKVSPHRAWVAERNGEVIGFGMAAQRDEMTFLSFLFVRPDIQAQGVGRALLERCMVGSNYRAVCIFSVQPISTALYARFDMIPLVPMYTFIGRPRHELPGLAKGFSLGDLALEGAAGLDQEVAGFTRSVDHDAWLEWGRRPFGLYERDELVGYAYAHQSGRCGPLVVSRPELLLPFLGEVTRAIEPADAWMVNVPGPAAETFSALLHAGFRLDGPPLIYCASRPGIDHSRYLPSTYALP